MCIFCEAESISSLIDINNNYLKELTSIENNSTSSQLLNKEIDEVKNIIKLYENLIIQIIKTFDIRKDMFNIDPNLVSNDARRSILYSETSQTKSPKRNSSSSFLSSNSSDHVFDYCEKTQIYDDYCLLIQPDSEYKMIKIHSYYYSIYSTLQPNIGKFQNNYADYILFDSSNKTYSWNDNSYALCLKTIKMVPVEKSIMIEKKVDYKTILYKFMKLTKEDPIKDISNRNFSKSVCNIMIDSSKELSSFIKIFFPNSEFVIVKPEANKSLLNILKGQMSLRSLKFEDFILYDIIKRKHYSWDTESSSIISDSNIDLKLFQRCSFRNSTLDQNVIQPRDFILSNESMNDSICSNSAVNIVKEKKNVKLVRRKLITKNDLKFYDWYIDPNEITIGPKIGSGTFGIVYKGQWHGDVAVKMLNVSEPNDEQLESFANELAVLRRTRHFNILLFVGCLHFPRMAIVTQWCDGSTLYNQLHIESIEYHARPLVQIALQISLGLEYLHAKAIIHRDLKSKNIFLQNGLHVKIGDFGLATLKEKILESNGIKQPSGSILWMAPEIIRMSCSSPYSTASDIYAFGIVLYELLSHELPYFNIASKDQILYMVGRGFLKPDENLINHNYPLSLIHCYHDCIKFNKDERIELSKIVQILQMLNDSLPKFDRSMSFHKYTF